MDYYKFVANEELGPPGSGRVWSSSCIAQGVKPHTELIDTYFKPVVDTFVNTSASSIVATTSSEWKNVTQQSRGVHSYYYGDAVSPEFLYRFLPRTTPRSWKHVQGSGKDFRRRKANGDIVLRPYSVGRVEITQIPGFSPEDVVNTRSLTYLRYFGGYVVDKTVSRCGRRLMFPLSGDMIQEFPEVQDPVLVPAARVTSRYTRYTLRDDAYGAYPFLYDRSLESAVDAFIADLQVVKPLPGLVTATHCEANIGAWDVLTSAMENLRETLPMILRSAIQANDIYRSARGKISNRKSLSQGSLVTNAASIWMWYRYAVQPLALDIQNLLRFLESQYEQYRSYRKGEWKEIHFSHNGWSGSVRAQDRCMVRHKYAFHKLDQLFISTEKTAWELLPLRFMVDWFVNVMDVITALETPANVDQVKMSYSTRVNDTLVLTHPDYPGEVHVKLDTYARNTHNNQLSYIDIDFRNDLTWKRFIDSLALLWGGLKNPHRYR